MQHRSAAVGLGLLSLWLAATMMLWALAFPPGPTDTAPPAWLARLQAVCFGSAADGMPAGYGWGLLIATPMGMLAVLSTGWRQETAAAMRWAASRWAGRLALAAVALVVAGEAAWVAWRVDATRPSETAQIVGGSSMPEGYARLNRPAPALQLQDQDARTVSLADYEGRVVLLTFAYGHCTTVCPVVVANVASAVRQSAPDGLDALVVSLDPWRDGPEALSGLAERWNAPSALRILSGPVPAVLRVLDAFDIAMRRDEDTGEIDHAALVYVLDPQGRIAYALLNPSPEWLLEAAKRARDPA